MATEVRADLEAIQASVRELARTIIAPRAADIDRTAEFPWDIVELFRQQDIFAIPFAPEYGGLSGSSLTMALAVEEIAKVCATSALLLALQGLGSYPILLAGTEQQKREFLPELASGRSLAAYALSEPDAGSDPASMTTRARLEGDEYVLDGVKTWISNGTVAGLIVVLSLIHI